MGTLYIIGGYLNRRQSLLCKILPKMFDLVYLSANTPDQISNALKTSDVLVHGNTSNIYRLKQFKNTKVICLLAPEKAQVNKTAFENLANHKILPGNLKVTLEQVCLIILEERLAYAT